MHPNLKKLMDAGLLNVSDPSKLPADFQNRVANLTDKDIEALSHLKKNLDPELLKTHSQFIFM